MGRLVTTVRGDTYPIRTNLKSLGFRWNERHGLWQSERALSDSSRKNLVSMLRDNGVEHACEVRDIDAAFLEAPPVA